MLWTRGRGFNGGLRDPGVQVPGRGRAGDPREPAGAARSQAALCHPAAGSVRAARGARSRFAEARLLRRARLVRHTHVRPGRHDGLGILDRCLRERHVAARRAAFPRHGSGLPPSFHLGAMLAAVVAHAAVDHAGAAGAALQSARDSQLGRRRDADLGAGHDDLAALPRFAPQLPERRRKCRHAHAAQRMRREPQPGRAAARAVLLFLRDETVREEIQPQHDCNALLVQYSRPRDAAGTAGGLDAGVGRPPPRRRHRALSCSTCRKPS